MEVNTDKVGCSAIFEIRETQNPAAPINTFGNGNLNPSSYENNIQQHDSGLTGTQYSNPTPGPPFHLANLNSIDMNTHNAQYIPPQVSAQVGLGATSTDFTPAGFAFADGNEMDLTSGNDQPSPATISSNSRGGSTSHSSYSPGQQTEHHLPYRASPKSGFAGLTNNGMNTMPPNANPAAFPGFPASTVTNANTQPVELFSTAFSTTDNLPDETFNQGFLVGNDWEYGALNSGTGMTPMSDGGWDQMLESVTMGWDAVGPPRTDTHERRT